MLEVRGDAMAPTLRDGDRITYDEAVYRDAPPQRGDIVVLRRNVLRILRVVGLPGETLTISGGRLLVSDVPLDEPYLAPGTRTDSPTATFAVPAGSYFLLNDNRARAGDSRDQGFGFVAGSEILGRVSR